MLCVHHVLLYFLSLQPTFTCMPIYFSNLHKATKETQRLHVAVVNWENAGSLARHNIHLIHTKFGTYVQQVNESIKVKANRATLELNL